MILDEETHIETLNSYPPEKWKPLLDLIPEIEATKQFGEWKGGEEVEKDVFQMPYVVGESIVDRFLDLVYEIPVMIGFDWGAWVEGRKMAGNTDFDYDTVDIPTKCKLITAIVRNDRFCEGRLVGAFEEGLILKLLKSIEKEVGK